METMTKKTLSVFLEHASKYRAIFTIILVTVFACTVLDLVRPFMFKYMFEALGATTPVPESNLDTALTFFYIWMGLAVLRFVIWRSVGWYNNKFQPRVISDLMDYCYEYMLGHSYSFFSNNFSGSIQTRVRKFAYAFESVADQVCFDLGRSLLLISMLWVVLLIYYWQVGVIVLIWTILYFTFTYFFTKYKLKYDIAQAEQDTRVTAHLADTLSNHSNINLFAAHDREVGVFKTITNTLFELRKKAWDVGLFAEVVQGVMMIALEWVVMRQVLFACAQGSASIGDLAFVQIYLARVFEHTWSMGRHIRKVYEQLANANEMAQMLTVPHEVVDMPGAEDLVVKQGNVEFSNITFAYDKQQPIFENFNLLIEGGMKLAFVGDSGGGKSTLVKMLQRQVNIQGGQVLIDGQNISEVTQDSLHELVTSVPQDPCLFHRTLRDNIMYGCPTATEEEMISAAKAAHCHEFIGKLTLGYDTYVGERGVKLSGGERQRVAIARAILRNSPILILDEATSSLDSESESYIQDALKTLMKGKTSIVIAHRLSTIKEMDWIVVIENGKIIEQGTHESLVDLCGKYSRHWDIQSGGFSAALAA